MFVVGEDTTSGESFDLVMGELDDGGYLIAVRVVQEGLSREQAVTALDFERSTQLQRAGRGFDVTRSDGDSFELLDTQGRSYRRYFLERGP